MPSHQVPVPKQPQHNIHTWVAGWGAGGGAVTVTGREGASDWGAGGGTVTVTGRVGARSAAGVTGHTGGGAASKGPPCSTITSCWVRDMRNARHGRGAGPKQGMHMASRTHTANGHMQAHTRPHMVRTQVIGIRASTIHTPPRTSASPARVRSLLGCSCSCSSATAATASLAGSRSFPKNLSNSS